MATWATLSMIKRHEVMRQVSRNKTFNIHKQKISHQSIARMVTDENQNNAQEINED